MRGYQIGVGGAVGAARLVVDCWRFVVPWWCTLPQHAAYAKAMSAAMLHAGSVCGGCYWWLWLRGCRATIQVADTARASCCELSCIHSLARDLW